MGSPGFGPGSGLDVLHVFGCTQIAFFIFNVFNDLINYFFICQSLFCNRFLWRETACCCTCLLGERRCTQHLFSKNFLLLCVTAPSPDPSRKPLMSSLLLHVRQPMIWRLVMWYVFKIFLTCSVLYMKHSDEACALSDEENPIWIHSWNAPLHHQHFLHGKKRLFGHIAL